MRLSALHVCVALGALCTACTVSGAAHTPAPPAAGTQHRPAAAASPAARHVVPGGCGGTPVLAGSPPSWNARPAGFSEQPFLSYAAGRGDSVMGYLWAQPLYVPEPSNRSNKILWYVRYPRDGSPLWLAGHLESKPGRAVSESFPDNASPGEIYPSDVTVPAPGCWSFTVRRGTHVDHLSLLFKPLPHQ